MKINKLSLKKFRNYDNLDIEFNNNLNIIIGSNAQGKTNILEAIYFLSITKSFLSVNDKTVIKREEKFSSINGIITTKDGNKKLSLLINDNGKKLEINSKEIKKHSEYIGNIKIIIFSPDNVRLIKDGPGCRRRFLNIEISQLYNKYINILNEFNIILKQRNEYLKIIKNGKYNDDYFKILNDKFVSLSVNIYKYRDDFINKINEYIDDIYMKIAGFKGLNINYITNINISSEDKMKEELLNKLNINKEREILYGSTLVGPHRDDFNFNIDNYNLSLYGSSGQIKMAILAFRLAEIEVFKDICLEYPVLLLDDLFSELDVDKRNKIINYLNKDIQTIVTTTDINNIDKKIVENSYIYTIDNGKIIDKCYNN